MGEPMTDDRRDVLDALVAAWAQRDRDNPQGAGADAGAAASALSEALAALDTAIIERDAEIRRAEDAATDAAGERDEIIHERDTARAEVAQACRWGNDRERERDEALDRIDALNQRHEEDEAYRQHMIAELRAARAEVERLRAAASEERADVVAWLYSVDRVGDNDCGALIYADRIEQGAHVGAAKGGEHG